LGFDAGHAPGTGDGDGLGDGVAVGDGVTVGEGVGVGDGVAIVTEATFERPLIVPSVLRALT
jgi:hypothetical protein